MPLVTDGATLSVTLSSISLVAVLKLAFDYGQLKLKVETMWGFQMRRSMDEALKHSIVTRNSPLNLSPPVREALEPIRAEVQALYRKICKWTEMEQFIAIEENFGERLVDLICLPFNVNNGACIVAVMLYGRELMGIKAA